MMERAGGDPPRDSAPVEDQHAARVLGIAFAVDDRDVAARSLVHLLLGLLGEAVRRGVALRFNEGEVGGLSGSDGQAGEGQDAAWRRLLRAGTCACFLSFTCVRSLVRVRLCGARARYSRSAAGSDRTRSRPESCPAAAKRRVALQDLFGHLNPTTRSNDASRAQDPLLWGYHKVAGALALPDPSHWHDPDPY